MIDEVVEYINENSTYLLAKDKLENIIAYGGKPSKLKGKNIEKYLSKLIIDSNDIKKYSRTKYFVLVEPIEKKETIEEVVITEEKKLFRKIKKKEKISRSIYKQANLNEIYNEGDAPAYGLIFQFISKNEFENEKIYFIAIGEKEVINKIFDHFDGPSTKYHIAELVNYSPEAKDLSYASKHLR